MSRWWENSDLWIMAVLALAIAGPQLMTMASTSVNTAAAVTDEGPSPIEPVADTSVDVIAEPQPVSTCRQPADVCIVGWQPAASRRGCH